jgi:ATP-dependent DNA helicase RecG
VTQQIFSNLQNLAGIGDKLASFLSGLIGGNRIVDLLYHQPSHTLPKKFLPPLYEIRSKELIITKVKVEAYIKPANSRQPFRVCCFAPSGYLTLTFFKTFPNYIEKNFPIGAEIVVSGIAERFNDELQIAHPDYVFPASQIDKIPKDEIVYPAIGAFSQKFLRSKIALALTKVTDLPEWIDGNLLKQQGWGSWKDSISGLHYSSSPRCGSGFATPTLGSLKNDKRNELMVGFTKPDPQNNKFHKRLAFDELLASQIANLIAKKYLKTKNGLALENKNILRQKLLDALPFKLTHGQQKVLAEIDSDLTTSKKMLRLLQGDVGSGKTIVAFLAMLLAVENKKQAAIICPITLLAFQHHKNFAELAEKIGVNIAILTSKTTAKNKQRILHNLKNGEINILIGTHSLLEPDIIFKDLAIAVIDEQHRFGVMQRMKLVEKGPKVDVLLMTATPIPRSLMMTFYGDMDISILNEKPKNRLAIDTRVISQNKDQEILQAIARAVKNGEKIYWICPLISSSDEEEISRKSLVVSRKSDEEEIRADDDLSNVTARFEEFQKLFGEEKVDLIHGKMKEKEKDKIMNNFISGASQILVATTVIEVGIDVSDATIIVIENPEQFGLSQLHQLRGRVGRGEKQSYCILLYGKKLGMNSKTRLAIMKNSNDGFFIAEEDLKLRGQGEMAGKRQSGLPEYKIADLNCDLDLLQIANRQAQLLLENQGKKIDKETLRILLKIFNYEDCFRLIFGG